MEKISITRIQGSSPGYVGYEDASFLDRVRRKPYSVILLDEIEKANNEVFNLFLQVLDDGHMTDSHGRKVNFKNCVLLMTSNVGTKMIKDFGSGIGFSKKDSNVDFKSTLEKELKKKFAPEFINRLDDIIYFRDLNKEDISKIVTLELNKSINRAKQLEIDIEVDESLMEHLVEVGYDPQYGARPLKRAIQRYVDDPITDYIILNNPEKGTKLLLSWDKEDENVKIKVPNVKNEKKKNN
jgi:ATP-dependent Clp protease ATP-binding subunit ClpC